jgi:midasin
MDLIRDICRATSSAVDRGMLRDPLICCYVVPLHRANNFQVFSTHLNQVLSLWWNMFEFVHSNAFDDSIFQVHLSAWKDWLLSCSEGAIPPQLTQTALEALDMFKSAWQLSTGLYMEKLWKLLKPTVPSSTDQFQALSRMRKLAVRFDAVIWKSRAPIEMITSIRRSIANALETILRTDPDCTALLKVGRRYWY